ncbi:MAG: hypothetical protein U1E78_08760 [Gammaproteobacteria bacterium]
MGAGFEWDAEKGELKWPDSFSESKVGLEQQKENFKAFVSDKSQLSSENINFLLEVEKFIKKPSIELRDQIIDKFTPNDAAGFNAQSNFNNTPVNLDSAAIKVLKTARETNILNPNLFDQIAIALASMMSHDTLQKFNGDSGKDFKDRGSLSSEPSPASTEPKGFSLGGLLSGAGKLLLSGLKEVGKFLFSSSSENELLTGGVNAWQEANPKRHFDTQWSKALAAAEALTDARNKNTEVETAKENLVNVIGGEEKSRQFLKDFEKAYPEEYKAYIAAKAKSEKSSGSALDHQVDLDGGKLFTPTLDGHKQTVTGTSSQPKNQQSNKAEEPKIGGNRPGRK